MLVLKGSDDGAYHRINGFLDFFHRPVFYRLENTTFRKLDLFPSSGEGGSALVFGFVGYVCSTNFYFLFYPSSTHVRALSLFLLYIFLLSSPN
jgi:hypothetical protein